MTIFIRHSALSLILFLSSLCSSQAMAAPGEKPRPQVRTRALTNPGHQAKPAHKKQVLKTKSKFSRLMKNRAFRVTLGITGVALAAIGAYVSIAVGSIYSVYGGSQIGVLIPPAITAALSIGSYRLLRRPAKPKQP
jgi:hypothetical protein